MGTFLEIVSTSLLTFCVGFLFLKYQSGTKRMVKRHRRSQLTNDRSHPKPVQLGSKLSRLAHQPERLHRNTSLKKVYHDYSPKFILIILLAMTFFSSVFYLAERGVIILKW